MTLIQKALNKSYELHKNQTRKNGNITYMVHILDVTKYLMYETNNQYVIAAGLLHDTIEDTPYERNELLEDFGQKVFDIVIFCTENGNHSRATNSEMKQSWKKRKEESIAKLASGSYDECLVFLADKTANLLSMKEDLDFGVDLWSMFNASKEEVEWYYVSVRDSLKNNLGATRLFHVFESLFSVFESVDEKIVQISTSRRSKYDIKFDILKIIASYSKGIVATKIMQKSNTNHSQISEILPNLINAHLINITKDKYTITKEGVEELLKLNSILDG